MAKELGVAELEAQIQKELAGGKDASEIETDMTDPDNFNIAHNKPLPEGFENPPCGEDGHFCVTRGGIHMANWFQLKIFRIHAHQEDPQNFPLGRTLQVKLEVWTDVPPEIIESLKCAIEEHHDQDITDSTFMLGDVPEITTTTRRRFQYEHMKSAKVA